MQPAAMPAASSARRITASCAGPLGAVSPLVVPSWFIAEPRTSARMRSPAARASRARLSTTTPQPSLRTKPSARASNALQRPSDASARAREKNTVSWGARMALTPPASATSHSPARRLWHARWIATSDDEHAVSTTRLGPRRSSRYEIRLAMMLSAAPVTLWASIAARSVQNSSP